MTIGKEGKHEMLLASRECKS